MLQDNKETPTEHFGWKLLRCKLHFTNDRGGGGLVAKSCLTLCDPMDCSPQGSSVHGILQARILEWVAISFSRASSQPRNRTQASCIIGRFFYQLSRKGDKWRQLKDIFIKQELEKDPRKTVTWKSSPTNCGILKYFKLKSRRVISVNVWVQY